MAINLSGLAPRTTAATALANLVLVSPQSTQGYQPQNPPNLNGDTSTQQKPPAILFHYEGEQTVQLTSDITDHFIEDNTAIQDQIALKPEIVTTHGYIGELNNVPPKGLALLKSAADRLTVINAYAPQASITAQIAYNEAFLLYQVAANAANSAVAAWTSVANFFTGDSGESIVSSTGLKTASNQNKQQVAFQQFYGYWRSRTLFTVQTPWAVFQNMAIASLRAIQSEETRVITDFEVQFKMIRNASTLTIGSGVPISYSGQAATQASGLTDLGTSSPTPSTSLGDGIVGVA